MSTLPGSHVTLTLAVTPDDSPDPGLLLCKTPFHNSCNIFCKQKYTSRSNSLDLAGPRKCLGMGWVESSNVW